MTLLSGKDLRETLKARILEDNAYTKLSYFLFSDKDNIDCFYYLRGIRKVLTDLSIPYEEAFYDKGLGVDENLARFKAGMKDRQVILARPLGIREEPLFLQAIDYRQDPDMMAFANKGRLYDGDLNYLPATALSVKTILDGYHIDLTGKTCLVVGRSNTVGLPVAQLVNRYNGMVVLAHSRIPEDKLQEMAGQSDVIFLCTGKPGLIHRDSLTEDTIVIDCGFSKGGGDLGFIPEEDELRAYTPVPGGVGSLTSYCLILNSLTHLHN